VESKSKLFVSELIETILENVFFEGEWENTYSSFKEAGIDNFLKCSTFSNDKSEC